MMRQWRVLVVLMGILLLTGCLDPAGEDSIDSDPQSLVLMSWNCQNLFDGNDDGTEYDEFDPGRGLWTEELYRKRLERTANIILSHGPDILFLQEVENRQVVEDLNRALGRKGFPWRIISDREGCAVQLAILSRYPLDKVLCWQPGYFGEETLRPVMEARVRIGSESFLLFNNHWKSRREGVPETEEARRMSASVLARRCSDVPVIAAGDFNADWDDPDLAGTTEAGRPALFRWTGDGFPLEAHLPVIPSDDFLPLSPLPKGVLVDPWDTAGSPGSYSYRNEWSRPDHFFLSPCFFEGTGWVFVSFDAGGGPELFNAQGEPNRWITGTGEGFSDHLPLRLVLARRSGE